MTTTLAPESSLLAADAQTAQQMRGVLLAGRRRAYALAGSSTLTVRSTRTGQRFTYRISESPAVRAGVPNRPQVHFVSLLSGTDGEYRYLGTIFANGFRTTRKSAVASNAPAAVAFSWLVAHWESPLVEVWHEGVCGRCGRALTVPESIESGIGPTCAAKMGLVIAPVPRPGRAEARAEALADLERGTTAPVASVAPRNAAEAAEEGSVPMTAYERTQQEREDARARSRSAVSMFSRFTF